MEPRTSIAALTRPLALRVAAFLRPRDRVEVLACVPAGLSDAEGLLWWVDHITAGGEAWVAMVDDEPVAMGGIRGIDGRPDLACTWCVGTGRKLEAGAAIFRHALRIHARWHEIGVERFQCSCLDSPEESSAWLERLGYVREGVLRHIGKNRENFIIWGKIYG